MVSDSIYNNSNSRGFVIDSGSPSSFLLTAAQLISEYNVAAAGLIKLSDQLISSVES